MHLSCSRSLCYTGAPASGCPLASFAVTAGGGENLRGVTGQKSCWRGRQCPPQRTHGADNAAPKRMSSATPSCTVDGTLSQENPSDQSPTTSEGVISSWHTLLAHGTLKAFWYISLLSEYLVCGCLTASANGSRGRHLRQAACTCPSSHQAHAAPTFTASRCLH